MFNKFFFIFAVVIGGSVSAQIRFVINDTGTLPIEVISAVTRGRPIFIRRDSSELAIEIVEQSAIIPDAERTFSHQGQQISVETEESPNFESLGAHFTMSRPITSTGRVSFSVFQRKKRLSFLFTAWGACPTPYLQSILNSIQKKYNTNLGSLVTKEPIELFFIYQGEGES